MTLLLEAVYVRYRSGRRWLNRHFPRTKSPLFKRVVVNARFVDGKLDLPEWKCSLIASFEKGTVFATTEKGSKVVAYDLRYQHTVSKKMTLGSPSDPRKRKRK